MNKASPRRIGTGNATSSVSSFSGIDTPPTFLFHTTADAAVPASFERLYARASAEGRYACRVSALGASTAHGRVGSAASP